MRQPHIRAAELLKACRGCWASIDDLARVLDASETSAQLWADEFVTQGLLTRRFHQVSSGQGARPRREYTVSVAWGGELP